MILNQPRSVGYAWKPDKHPGGIILLSLSIALLQGCARDDNGPKADIQDSAPAAVTSIRLIAADNEPGNWMSHGRTYSEQRFSPLDHVNVGTVDRLGLAWYYDLDTRRGQEATPLVIDGVMYSTSAWSKVQALEAATGKLLWQYDPEVPGEWVVHACCDVVNRGVAAWQGRVFFGTLDGRLISLDAETGEVVWETLTIDRAFPYTITGAPRIVNGQVIIGNAGAEFGVRGYVSAYDAESGGLTWRFYTVPGNPADPLDNNIHRMTARTWTGDWWKYGGGGTVWDSMAYDPELKLLYIGVGNGSPWDRDIRSPGGGDNLFLSSIVALRPDTGEYVWHYQTTPGDQWDYTATQHMILADMEIHGRTRKVLMQAPKNGFFYVIDRETGELLSAAPFVPVNWASHIDLQTRRPVEDANARYRTAGKPWLASPGPLGAHNWHPMAFNPDTGFVYIPAQEVPFPYAAEDDYTSREFALNLGIDLAAAALPDDPEIKAQVRSSLRGHLAAWDPVQQEEVWRVQHAGPWNGGVLTTAGGLVFQGNAAGSLAAYDAATGEVLWSHAAQTGIIAPPMTFAVDGVQFIAVVAGWGGAFPLLAGELADISGKQQNRSRILAFRLDGGQSLPEIAAMASSVAVPAPPFADDETVSHGKAVYQRFCLGCHGDTAVSGGLLPDLRRSAAAASSEIWSAVVLGGTLSTGGMAGYADAITPAEAEAIRGYVLQRAHDTL
ncbi:MAG: PQQ-dependent dehydrogenase, methanol/ethanol family [Woeseia sp.]